MDIRTIRKTNLERLIQEAGSVAELGRRTEVNETYLGQVRRGVGGKGRNRARALGDAAARKLEEGMHKPYGWMDVSHPEETGTIGEFTIESATPPLRLPGNVSEIPPAEYLPRGWPFSAPLLDRVLALDTYHRGVVEGRLRSAIEECEHDNGRGAASGKA